MKAFFIKIGHALKAFFIKLWKVALPVLTVGLSEIVKTIWRKMKERKEPK